MDENEIAKIVMDRCLDIHKTLGPMLYRVYRNSCWSM